MAIAILQSVLSILLLNVYKMEECWKKCAYLFMTTNYKYIWLQIFESYTWEEMKWPSKLNLNCVIVFLLRCINDHWDQRELNSN